MSFDGHLYVYLPQVDKPELYKIEHMKSDNVGSWLKAFFGEAIRLEPKHWQRYDDAFDYFAGAPTGLLVSTPPPIPNVFPP